MSSQRVMAGARWACWETAMAIQRTTFSPTEAFLDTRFLPRMWRRRLVTLRKQSAARLVFRMGHCWTRARWTCRCLSKPGSAWARRADLLGLLLAQLDHV